MWDVICWFVQTWVRPSCVCNIWIDVKLLFFFCPLPFLKTQGAQVWLWFLCQRRRPEVTVISKGDVPLTYLLQISFFGNGTWLTQEPPCRFICQPFALFNLLHCCRNLALFYFYFGLRCIRTFLRKLTSHWNSRWINQFFPGSL